VQDTIPVLITGMGGALGISFLKALRMSSFPCQVFGTDVEPLAVGLHMCDAAYILPDSRTEPDTYLAKLVELCRAQKIRILFAGSEVEMRLLARHKKRLEKESGAVMLVNGAQVTETACDKWKTAQFLQKKGLPVPDSVLPERQQDLARLIERHGYPLIVKPRSSYGSQGLYLVPGERELNAALVLVKKAIVQEYLTPDDQEYTVGVFMDQKSRPLGSIIFRRWLGGGLTHRAIVVKNPVIEHTARQAAAAFKAVGPINVQLRLTARGPVIFEVNPRMSSSTVMRAYFGFNEPELAIRQFVLGEQITPPRVKEGIAMRYWEELYI